MDTALNERVVVEVMGRQIIKTGPSTSAICNGCHVQNGTTYMILEDEPLTEWGSKVIDIPDYSGNIADAWLVVGDLLARKCLLFDLSQTATSHLWKCTFVLVNEEGAFWGVSTEQSTPSLAVCHAALNICEKLRQQKER